MKENQFLPRKKRKSFFFARSCFLSLCCIMMISSFSPSFAQPLKKNISKRSISSSTPYGYAQVGNTLLYYKQESNSIDFQGVFNGLYYGSTFADGGYRVAMQVNGNSPSEMDCLNGSTLDGVTFKASVESQGELARICYSITNTTNEDVVVSLGTHADVMIGNNDRAPISRRVDTAGNTYGITMKDGNGAQLCVLFGSGLSGVTSVNDYWFGYYYLNYDAYSMVGNYSSGSNYMEENGSYDSGMGWCWKDRTIGAESTIVFSYLIGVGEVNLEPNSSFEVTPDDPDGWNDLSRPHRLTLEGTYESPAGLEGRIEYSVEDSGEWASLTDMLPSGGAFTESLVATFDASRDQHIIRFRAVDNVGNTTYLPSIVYKDVSFYPVTGIENMIYTGNPLFQSNLSCDIPAEEYTITNYQNNINAGTASFNVEGLFPYTIGRKTYTFSIEPQPLADGIVVEAEHIVYDGNNQYPSWSFINSAYSSLIENQDYFVSYENNLLPGLATVHVEGKGNYSGSLAATFPIDKAPLTSHLYTVNVPLSDISYDGKGHGATVSVNEGVGDCSIYYTLQGSDDFTEEMPVNEGTYDIYLSFADGTLYYGMEMTYMGSFSIYEFNDSEWELLKLLHAQLADANPQWAVKWNDLMASEGILSVGKLQGVIVEKGHLNRLDLSNENLSGAFPILAFTFPELKELNLSGNNFTDDMEHIVQEMYAYIMQYNPMFRSDLQILNISDNEISGNLGLFAYATEDIPALVSRFPELNTLLASGNKLNQVYPHLPLSISTLDLRNQRIDTFLDIDFSEFNEDSLVKVIPTLMVYNHKAQSYNTDLYIRLGNHPDGQVENYSKPYWGIDVIMENNNINLYCLADNTYKGQSGDTLYISYPECSPEVEGSFCMARHYFSKGDANFINGIDIVDIQTTINYLFGQYKEYPFNFTAADTYVDNWLNVQDIVCTANIIMDSEPQSHSNVSLKRTLGYKDEKPSAYIYAKNGKLILEATKPIAAFDIKFAGNQNVKFRLEELGYNVLNKQTNGNTRVIAYTLAGQYIPEGETVIAEYDGVAPNLLSIIMSDSDAKYMQTVYLGEVISIGNMVNPLNEPIEYYSIEGVRRVRPVKGVNIVKKVINGKTTFQTIYFK